MFTDTRNCLIMNKLYNGSMEEFLGYIPDYGQIAPETISRKG